MPEINGMQIAGFLRKKHNGEFIIFLTSHIEFMPNAFKVKAFRFLNKPIDIEKFEEAVLEAEKEILNNEKVTGDEIMYYGWGWLWWIFKRR